MNEVSVLQKLLLPRDNDWDIVGVEIQESNSVIIVDVSYNKTCVLEAGSEYSIYDYRPSRLWRHLDLWQYKTYLRARIPRYSIQGKVVSLEVSWADTNERITELLEKNDRNFTPNQKSNTNSKPTTIELRSSSSHHA